MKRDTRANDWLSRFADDTTVLNHTSQRGEDRILQILFREIGIMNRWCVEFGAADGQHRSNTWYWINKQDWSSVQIEAARDENLSTYIPWRDSFNALQQRYKNNRKVACLNQFVGLDPENRLDAILSRTALPKRFDLLSLDIDGAEYNIWQSLVQFSPRVVVIEHNKTIPIEIAFHSNRGSSLRALTELGRSKGYELVAANDLNGIFVLREEFDKLGIEDNTLEKIWSGKGAVRIELEEVNGYVALRGEDRLRWVRGKNGTVTGQIRAGHYLTIEENQASIPAARLLAPRRHVSGYIRHWWYTIINHEV